MTVMFLGKNADDDKSNGTGSIRTDDDSPLHQKKHKEEEKKMEESKKPSPQPSPP